jgi:hypothetical protein
LTATGKKRSIWGGYESGDLMAHAETKAIWKAVGRVLFLQVELETEDRDRRPTK